MITIPFLTLLEIFDSVVKDHNKKKQFMEVLKLVSHYYRQPPTELIRFILHSIGGYKWDMQDYPNMTILTASVVITDEDIVIMDRAGISNEFYQVVESITDKLEYDTNEFVTYLVEFISHVEKLVISSCGFKNGSHIVKLLDVNVKDNLLVVYIKGE